MRLYPSALHSVPWPSVRERNVGLENWSTCISPVWLPPKLYLYYFKTNFLVFFVNFVCQLYCETGSSCLLGTRDPQRVLFSSKSLSIYLTPSPPVELYILELRILKNVILSSNSPSAWSCTFCLPPKHRIYYYKTKTIPLVVSIQFRCQLYCKIRIYCWLRTRDLQKVLLSLNSHS